VVIDLQAAVSVFWDDPRIFNPVSYLVCGALLLLWSARTLATRLSQERIWLALAAIAPITILVTYHRPWDAKLLIITIPACAMLWARGGPIRWIALVVTTVGIVFTADVPLAILKLLGDTLHVGTAGIYGKMVTVLLLRPAPLILLAMSAFYLWMYLRCAIPDSSSSVSQLVSAQSEPLLKAH
jgi:hypothetical protein